jgi:hypothetical protein
MKKAKSSARRKRTAVKDLATRKAGGVNGGNVVPTTPETTAVHIANGAVSGGANQPQPLIIRAAQTTGART